MSRGSIEKLICNDLCQDVNLAKDHHRLFCFFLKASWQSCGLSVPCIGHSDIRGFGRLLSLPTGQWSAVSTTVY